MLATRPIERQSNAICRTEMILREPFTPALDWLRVWVWFDYLPSRVLVFEDVAPVGASDEDVSAGLVQRINLELERCPI